MRAKVPTSAALLGCLSAFVAACVPMGAPPAGRQLVADRISTPAGVVRSNGDGVTRVLVTRPDPDAVSVDLYVVSVDQTNAPPVERLLATNISPGFNIDCAPGPYTCSDARGRVFVSGASGGAVLGNNSVVRLDPVTGDRVDFGPVSFYEVSPSGERLIVFPDPLDGTATLYEADDRVIPLAVPPSGTWSAFVGEVLYYLTSDADLMRLSAGGTPELVATGVESWSAPTVTGDPLLLLRRPTADPALPAQSILDTVTGSEAPLPAGTALDAVVLSPDGHWVVTMDDTRTQFTFTDWTAGFPDSFSATVPISGIPWRPGHDEIWQPNLQLPNPTITISKPGASPIELPGFLTQVPDSGGQYPSFTPDGAYWFSSPDFSMLSGVQLVSADAPAQPGRDLGPPSDTVREFWPLADGRVLAEAFTTTRERCDVFAVDPVSGHSQVLGETGVVMAVGRTRLLVNQHVLDDQGDLTVFDLPSGRSTVLAPEFATGPVFVEPVGADPAAPGADVEYQFQARFPSDYDGIWLATVP